MRRSPLAHVYLRETRRLTYGRHVSNSNSLEPEELVRLNEQWKAGRGSLLASEVVVGNYPNGAPTREPINALFVLGNCFYFVGMEREPGVAAPPDRQGANDPPAPR